MIIEKYLFCLSTGMEKVARRMQLEDPPGFNDLAMMYAIKRSPSTTYSGLIRFIRARRTFHDKTFKLCFKKLLALELIRKEEGRYYLTTKGLEYMSSVRRYLVNIRL